MLKPAGSGVINLNYQPRAQQSGNVRRKMPSEVDSLVPPSTEFGYARTRQSTRVRQRPARRPDSFSRRMPDQNDITP
ncbi:hypothetical protein [uncultured Bradyrhizobium sp.]|uniref:hypothetical protein n=1 Tax=uncultured Bradyrhizobium sp. TaxID=199684 RepID=UPI002608417B|nr:hypothetical protein [uncultured Bradyrhizobium sp.]